jgi:raffinose/stachyose/melibiose transport system permease protein
MTNFFKDVYREIEESSFMDGCNNFQIYWNILLPITKPAIVTVAIYNFLNIWNEFIYALVLINSTAFMTLPLGMKEFYGREAVNVPGILTAVLVGTLPMILFFILAQEKVIKSLVAGAVKG